MKSNHYCGECALFLEEDMEGEGYCATKDLYTFQNCGDPACEEFIEKPQEYDR